jgi:hypothetical protein
LWKARTSPAELRKIVGAASEGGGTLVTPHLGLDGILAPPRRDVDDAAFREAQNQAVHRLAIPLRRRKGECAFDRVFERRNADRAGRQFDFVIDENRAPSGAGLRRITVLEIHWPIAGAKPEIGARG